MHGLYALVEPARAEPVAFTEALLRGGIRLFQIRAKDGIDGATLLAIVQRELGVMVLAALVMVVLLARAAGTAG